MATPGATRFCKICGVEYPYCHTNVANQYRWQDVACCKEHAAEYFAAIAVSRGLPVESSMPAEYYSLLKSHGANRTNAKEEDKKDKEQTVYQEPPVNEPSLHFADFSKMTDDREQEKFFEDNIESLRTKKNRRNKLTAD